MRDRNPAILASRALVRGQPVVLHCRPGRSLAVAVRGAVLGESRSCGEQYDQYNRCFHGYSLRLWLNAKTDGQRLFLDRVGIELRGAVGGGRPANGGCDRDRRGYRRRLHERAEVVAVTVILQPSAFFAERICMMRALLLGPCTDRNRTRLYVVSLLRDRPAGTPRLNVPLPLPVSRFRRSCQHFSQLIRTSKWGGQWSQTDPGYSRWR